MSGDDRFTIYHEWLGHLFYWETAGHSIVFEFVSDEPLEVRVPMPDQWRGWAPEWARERRDIILQRLRDRGYRVIEEPFRQVSVPAPVPASRAQPPHGPVLRAAFCGLALLVLGIFLALEAWASGKEGDLWFAFLVIALFGVGLVVLIREWVKRTGPPIQPPTPPPSMRWVRDKDRRDE